MFRINLSHFLLKVSGKLLPPSFFWERNYKLSKKKNINPALFILSFDCDTDNDIRVVWDVHNKLMDMGITPVYAVPGELIKKGIKVYRRIMETGAEFINHGYREHMYFDLKENRYLSNFFYDQEPRELVAEDIILGHNNLQNELGITPKGWRTPHFGSFQKKEHFAFLYKLLKKHNYVFSTSTIPSKSYKFGPYFFEQGIWEIPVTGSFKHPLHIFDTWSYYAEPGRMKSPQGYLEECKSISDYVSQKPLLINIYGDPSHIHDSELFFEGMKLLSQSARNLNYAQLLSEIGK